MKKLLLSLAACLGLGFAANATTVTFNFESNDYGMPNDGDTYVTVPQTITEGDVTITLNGDENSWRMWSDGLRVYYKKNPTLTITSTGEKINSISWKVKSGVKFAETEGGEAITSWTGDAESVTLYGGVGSGNAALQTLTIVCGEEVGGGDEPSGPEAPTGTITVAEAIQLITDGYTGTAKVKGIISDITEVSTQYGNATYTIVDELGTDQIGLKIFRGKWLNGESFTASNQIAIGGTVEVEGNLSVYNEEPQMAQNNVILSYEAPEGGETPETPEGTITVAKAMELIGAGYTGTATVEGFISVIDEVSAQYGNATYTIVDELGTDQLGLLIYRGYWTNGDKFTTGNEIAEGGKVVVEGSLVNYNGTYEMTSGSKILSYVAPEGGDTPDPDQPEQPGEPGEGTVLNVNDAQNIEGTFVEEQVKEDGSIQAAAHYQPLESLTIDDYTFSFASNSENASQQPAYYYATSTNANQQATIRLYNGCTMTITAPEGEKMSKIEFKGSNLGKDAAFKADEGEFVFNGNNATWTGASNVVSINANATWRVTEVTVYLAGDSSAVEGIEAADNAEVVYYNLQGVKVNNPEKGIFVKVTGSKAVKVVL